MVYAQQERRTPIWEGHTIEDSYLLVTCQINLRAADPLFPLGIAHQLGAVVEAGAQGHGGPVGALTIAIDPGLRRPGNHLATPALQHGFRAQYPSPPRLR